MSEDPGPTDPSDRIVSLDVLRGFALLGILVINVQLFSMPYAAAYNPTVYGDFSGANYAVWLVSHVLAEQKFMTLFTLLFGAGIVLFTESKDRKGQPALRLHNRRVAWLLLIGLGHAYLLWYGDILVAYALCAFWAVGARDWTPRRQFFAGTLLLLVPSALEVGSGLVLQELPDAFAEQWAPTQATLQAEIDAYRGDWFEQMDHRLGFAFQAQTDGFLTWTAWRVTGLMLWGMALFRWGVLSNDRSTRFYLRLLAGGAVGGLVLILAGVWYTAAHDWSGVEAAFYGRQFNYWGSLPLAGAYVAGIMLFCRRWGGGVAATGLAAVGRTAFSNYLLQTALATTIFYGHGLGLFGSVSRVEQVAIVLLIWAIQVPLSVLWLRHYRFGPVEWVWRTLTYEQRQPLRRSDRPVVTEDQS